jgi:hypothetical protein
MIPSPQTAATMSEAQRTIPFDYVFRFQLEGVAGKTHSQIVAVSVEGTFTAVSIGYGIVPEPAVREFGLASPAVVPLSASSSLNAQSFATVIGALAKALNEGGKSAIGPRTASVLTNGIRVNPRVANFALAAGGGAPMSAATLERLFEVVPLPSDDVQFLYAIRDEGSGREYQSQPVLSTAGLGIANGDRPFRQFTRPMTFRPRSTIRMDVTEIPTTFKGALHVSLQGYKVLGGGPGAR